MSKRKSNKMNEKFGLQFIITIAVIEIALGALLLFVPQIEISTLCYLLCAALVITGIFLIVKYFLSDAYKNMDEYGFSIGVFFVILGMCALVRVEQVSASFLLCMGIALLMTSVIKFQNALDLKNLDEKTWIWVLAISLVFTVASVIIIINPFSSIRTLQLFTYRILIVDGIISLLSNFYLFIKLKQNIKQDKKKKEIKNMEENAEDTEEMPEEKAESDVSPYHEE